MSLGWKFFIALVLGLLIGEVLFAYPAERAREIHSWTENQVTRDHFTCYLLFNLSETDEATLEQLVKEDIGGKGPKDVRTMVARMTPGIQEKWLEIRVRHNLTQDDLKKALDKYTESIMRSRKINLTIAPDLLLNWDYCERYAK